MPRVLHLLSTNRFSGAENVACQIIRMFSDLPEYDMAYCSPDGPIADAVKSKGIFFLPMDRLSLCEIKRVIAAYKPDIIHAHDITRQPAGLFVISKSVSFRSAWKP